MLFQDKKRLYFTKRVDFLKPPLRRLKN